MKKAAVFLTVGLLLLWACEKRPPEEKVLVEMEGKVITLEEFQREVEELPDFLKPAMIDPKAKREFLKNIVDRELLLLEADRQGVSQRAEVKRKIEQCRKGVVLEAFLRDLFAGKDEVTDEEVRRYYEDNREDFRLQERIRVRDIVVRTREEAEEIKRRLAEGEDFAELARRYSISPTAKRGGDMGYIQRGQVGKEFEKAAFSLKEPGDISDIVKTTFGYHIIRLEDRKPPRQLAFEEVKEEIRQRLREEKRRQVLEEYLQDLRKKYKVTIREEVLEEGKGE